MTGISVPQASLVVQTISSGCSPRPEGRGDRDPAADGERHRGPLGALAEPGALLRRKGRRDGERSLDGGSPGIVDVVADIDGDDREIPALAFGVHAQGGRGAGREGAEEEPER